MDGEREYMTYSGKNQKRDGGGIGKTIGQWNGGKDGRQGGKQGGRRVGSTKALG